MAFVMNYDDKFGDSYPNSYWRPENWNFTKTTAEVTFVGYPDEAHKGGRIIGAHGYKLTPEQYTSYIVSAPIEKSSVFESISKQMYEMAINFKDDGLTSFFQDTINA